jgi:hypothetical protein
MITLMLVGGEEYHVDLGSTISLTCIIGQFNHERTVTSLKKTIFRVIIKKLWFRFKSKTLQYLIYYTILI